MVTTITKKPKPMPMPVGKPAVQLTAKEQVANFPSAVKEAPPKKTHVPTEYDASGKPIPEEVYTKLVGKQAVASVNKKFKDGTETDEHIKVGGLLKFSEPNATVGLSMAVTRNLGNFESVKMMVSLYIPCANTEEGINAAFDEAKGWVDTRVELLNQEISDQLGG